MAHHQHHHSEAMADVHPTMETEHPSGHLDEHLGHMGGHVS